MYKPTVSFTVTVAGSVDDFDANAYVSNLALSLGIDSSQVTVTVLAGSVQVETVIVADDASQAGSVGSSIDGMDDDAFSSATGVAVEARTATSTTPPPDDDVPDVATAPLLSPSPPYPTQPETTPAGAVAAAARPAASARRCRRGSAPTLRPLARAPPPRPRPAPAAAQPTAAHPAAARPPPPRPTAGCGAGTTPTFQSVTGTWLCEIDCAYQAGGRRLHAPPGDDLQRERRAGNARRRPSPTRSAPTCASTGISPARRRARRARRAPHDARSAESRRSLADERRRTQQNARPDRGAAAPARPLEQGRPATTHSVKWTYPIAGDVTSGGTLNVDASDTPQLTDWSRP